MSVGTELVHRVSDDWEETEATPAITTLEQVVFASHLPGANRRLANFGGSVRFGGADPTAAGLTVPARQQILSRILPRELTKRSPDGATFAVRLR